MDFAALTRYTRTMHVLIVEDHTDTRAVLALLLNRSGCKTVTAKTLQEARARIGTMQFDVLISDLNLPDGDGLDLVREAKLKQQLTAIALTGRTTVQERNDGLEAGFDYYLTKPIDFEELRRALNLVRVPLRTPARRDALLP